MKKPHEAYYSSPVQSADQNKSQAPEIQTMYTIPFPISTIRTRMRQQFERHRLVNKISVVDMLIMQNNAEYQVSNVLHRGGGERWEEKRFEIK